VIHFTPPPPQRHPDLEMPLGVCATSGLPVTLTATDVCEIHRSNGRWIVKVWVVRTECKVTATQAGNPGFAAAAAVSRDVLFDYQVVTLTAGSNPTSVRFVPGKVVPVRVTVTTSGGEFGAEVSVWAEGACHQDPAQDSQFFRGTPPTTIELAIVLDRTGTCTVRPSAGSATIVESSDLAISFNVVP
jgi:hypothetical protein